jgi:hypothetical protein
MLFSNTCQKKRSKPKDSKKRTRNKHKTNVKVSLDAWYPINFGRKKITQKNAPTNNATSAES